MMREAVVKIAALFSYCGGPLFITNALKPHLGFTAVFVLTFLPVGLMVLGAFFLEDDPRSRLSRAMVWAGRQGLYIALGMHLYALWCFANGVRVPDQSLHYIGIAVGVAWSIVYLRAARRWASPSSSTHSGDPASTDPIEPS